jgi:hypothetical protein
VREVETEKKTVSRQLLYPFGNVFSGCAPFYAENGFFQFAIPAKGSGLAHKIKYFGYISGFIYVYSIVAGYRKIPVEVFIEMFDAGNGCTRIQFSVLQENTRISPETLPEIFPGILFAFRI